MTNRKTAVFGVVAVVVVLTFGLYSAFGYGQSNPNTVSTVCTIPVEGDLLFQIVNSSSGTPIEGVSVDVLNLYPECPPNPHTVADLGRVNTDANGTIVVDGLGEFYLQVDYAGTYSVNASVGPVRATCVVLAIPSGAVRTQTSGSFETTC